MMTLNVLLIDAFVSVHSQFPTTAQPDWESHRVGHEVHLTHRRFSELAPAGPTPQVPAFREGQTEKFVGGGF